MEERLQKIIARAGVCSRREAERLIVEGQVTVNGELVTELGSKADAQEDHIKVNGKLVQPLEKFHYLLLHKPKGVVTSVSDPEGRPVVLDLVKGVKDRIYPVGRLDFNTEGALLLTNDGELANKLLHPGSNCPKTYIVKVSGCPDIRAIRRLERGVAIDGTRYGSSKIHMLKEGNNSWLEVVLTEGKNQQIRKMFEFIGHPVSKLKRIGFGFMTLKNLEVGTFRELTETEVARCKRGDYSPLLPINPYTFLKEYGVPVEARKLKANYMRIRESEERRKREEEDRGRRGPGRGGPGRGGPGRGGPRQGGGRGGPGRGGPRREGGPGRGGPRQDGPRREGGYQRRDGGPNREGGYQRREGGGPNREGGYQRRDGGGYQRREGGGPNREGGYQRRDGGGYQRREGGGGYENRGGYQRRDGGPRQGGPRQDGPPRPLGRPKRREEDNGED